MKKFRALNNQRIVRKKFRLNLKQKQENRPKNKLNVQHINKPVAMKINTKIFRFKTNSSIVNVVKVMKAL